MENIDISSYNIPSNAIVNQSNFIIDEKSAYEALSRIESPITNDFSEIEEVEYSNGLIYKQVYGGTGKNINYQSNGKDLIIKPGDDNYIEIYTELRKKRLIP